VHLASLVDGVQSVQAGFQVSDMNDEGAAVSDFNERLLARLKGEGIPLAVVTR
jgi:hypothetical protein